ncbi:MAG: hypothetical protein U0169_12845 [Polyangiaceae bacterium]
MNRAHRSAFVTLALVGAVPVVVACSGCKKDPPPPAPVVEAPTPVATVPPALDLTTLIDAGEDADAADADAAKKPTGPGLTNNQANAKRCCSALRSQATALGPSPEGAQLIALAATCDQMAMQLGPTSGPTSPEMTGLRTMLKSVKLPPACSGL